MQGHPHVLNIIPIRFWAASLFIFLCCYLVLLFLLAEEKFVLKVGAPGTITSYFFI